MFLNHKLVKKKKAVYVREIFYRELKKSYHLCTKEFLCGNFVSLSQKKLNRYSMTEPAVSRNIKLSTVKGTQVECNESPFYGNCRDVEDFEKLNRVGEGTYGVV